jgi:hypothetical protein
MKTGLLLLFGLVFIFQKQTIHSSTTQPMEDSTYSSETAQGRLYADVKWLTSVNPPRHAGNVNSLNQVADRIAALFKTLRCRTEIQPFPVDGQEYRNVIASFGPEGGPRIVVGAHYDVCGDQPGADDNASAVAGLLEIARMLDRQQPSLKYRVDLVAFSLEEPPYFATDHMGSAVHARRIQEQHIPVKAMICLEMIGYFSDKPNSQQFPDERLSQLYPNTGNFIIVVGKTGQEAFTAKIKQLMKQHAQVGVESINLPASMGLAGLSDHRNYWPYGIDAVMINDTSFLRNPNYHKKSDTIDTLDFDKMAEVVKGVYGAVLGL